MANALPEKNKGSPITYRVVIVQPYVPSYRRPFFDSLIETLKAQDIECVVVAGNPSDEQAQRGDSVDAPWLQRVKLRQARIGRRTIGLGGSRKYWKNADAVIIGLLGSSIDTNLAVLAGRFGRIKVGLWGHVKDYVNPSNPIDALIERWQVRNADRIFAYTPGGALYAEQMGVDPSRITTVMNTVDTSALVAEVKAVTSDMISEFITQHELVESKVLCFIGGLDSSKRVHFIAEMLDHLWEIDPQIRLLVAGDGAERAAFDAAVARGQAIMLGYASPKLLALVGAVSAAIVMPGRIGLVAVDALVLNIPILTTDWPFHAPEVEYLEEGTSRYTFANEPAEFAQQSRRFIRQLSPVPGQDRATKFPELGHMVSNFYEGIRHLLTK